MNKSLQSLRRWSKFSRPLFARRPGRRAKFVIPTLSLLVGAVLCVAPSLRAVTFTYSRTTGNTSASPDQWSAGTSWNAVPQSAATTTLNFSGALAMGVSVFTNDNIAGNFQLNALNFLYSGPASGTAPTVTISGNALEFVSNGGTTPVLNIAATGSFAPVLTISDNLVLDNNLSITESSAATLSGIISNTGNLTKTLTGTLTLTGANTYTGATILGTAGSTASAGTVTVSGASGTINTSSSYTVNGTGSQLNLDYTAGATVDRLKDTGTVTLNLGGELRFNANATAATATTETFGSLTLGTGSGIVTINETATGTNSLATITAGSFSRGSSLATGLIRGSSLGNGTTTAGRLILTSQTGLTQVGGSTTAGNVKLQIVPYLLADTTATGGGGEFATYDTTNGLRPLASTEYDKYNGGTAVTQTAGDNVAINGGTTTFNGTANSINSLFYLNSGTLTGAGTLTINSGAIGTINSGTTTLGGFSTLNLDNGEGVILNGDALTISSPIDVTSSGTHLAAGGLTKGNSGTLILTGANLYTGATTINSGTLQIGNGTTGSLAAGSGAVTVTPTGTLGLYLATGSALANNIADSGTVTTAGASVSTVSGNITGTGVVTVATAGSTLSLTGTANTYSGATTVSTGFLRATGDVFSQSSAIVLSPSSGTAGTSGLQLRSDTAATFNDAAGLSITVPGNTSASPRIATIDVGAAATGTGPTTLTLGGTVLFNINGSNTGMATLNVSSSTSGYALAIGAVSVAAGSGNNGFGFSTTGANLTIASITNPGNPNNPAAVTFSGDSNTTVTGALTPGVTSRAFTVNISEGTTGSLTLAGTGPVTTGSNGAGYFFNLNSGTLNLQSNDALGTGASASYSRTLNIAGGTLDSTKSGGVVVSASPLTNINGDFAFGGTNALNLTGTATLGTPAGVTRTITTNGANALTISASITDPLVTGGAALNSLVKAGTGTLILSGAASSYGGGTTVSNGILQMGSVRAIGGSASTTLYTPASNSSTTISSSAAAAAATVNGTGTFDLNGNSISRGTVSLSGTGYLGNGALINTGAAATIATDGVITNLTLGSTGSSYSGTPTVTFSGGGGTGLAGTAVLGVTSTTLGAGGSGYTNGAVVTISGGGGSGAAATATVVNGVVTAITITNPGTGYTTSPTFAIAGTGTGTPGSGATASAFNGVTAVNITSFGSGYTSAPTVSFSGSPTTSATATTTLPASTFVLAGNSSIGGTGGITINSAISGSGAGLTKVGANTLTLNGANTYSGGTTISGGKLLLTNIPNSNASSGTGLGAVTLSGGTTTTLSGTGNVYGLVTASNNSRIAPGINTSGTNTNFGNAGTLLLGTSTASGATANGLTLSSANLDFDLASTTAGTSDKITTAGALTLGSVIFTFNELTPGTLATAESYILIAGASNTADFSGVTGTVLQGDFAPTFSLDGSNDLVVSFTPIPEPSTVLGGFLLVGCLAYRGRRHLGRLLARG